MAKQGKGRGITWTEQTWNPIRGCSRISAGCRNCYAERTAARFSGPGQPYHGLAVVKNGEATWTGKVAFVPEHLDDPLRWAKPRLIFVNSMSDLFHEDLSAEKDIAPIFAVMALARWHTFQVLTKRAARMKEILTDPAFVLEVASIASARSLVLGRRSRTSIEIVRADECSFPLPNVWLGISAEDQDAADDRIPSLLDTPAAARWISAEPLIGPIDCGDMFGRYRESDREIPPGFMNETNPLPDWVVVGGESQKGCRPMDLAWARHIVDGCHAAGVPVFLKQLGGHPDARKVLADFPEDLRIQQYPLASLARRSDPQEMP